MKNILVHGVYQSAILFIIIFTAHKWVPEDPDYPVRNGNLIVSGWNVDLKGNDDYHHYESVRFEDNFLALWIKPTSDNGVQHLCVHDSLQPDQLQKNSS